MLLLHVPSFLGRHAGRAPCGPCSSCLDYSVRLWVTDLSLSLSLSLPVSVSVFEFAQIVLQVYRDKNLRFNLDLRTPSLSSLRPNIDLRTPSLSNLYLNLDLRTPSLSSLRLNLDLRNFEPFECQYPQYARG